MWGLMSVAPSLCHQELTLYRQWTDPFTQLVSPLQGQVLQTWSCSICAYVGLVEGDVALALSGKVGARGGSKICFALEIDMWPHAICLCRGDLPSGLCPVPCAW